ncbi:hypothetical protein BJV82DRAFT_630907 [Fennellomyces sp. T-0311]|nr:hypothetical protein BJV82DRAFT_630907 [Fennellomyces sp. T-0311]
MLSIRKACNTVVSAFTSNHVAPESKQSKQVSSVKEKARLQKAQLAAQKRIRKSPTSAHGYLASGEIYKQQGNLRAALSIYKQGAQHVAPHKAQHALLQKEVYEISGVLSGRSQKFQHLTPYDIWYLIFENLGFRDLLRCACVCKTWCNFLVDLPEFWEQFPAQPAEGLQPTTSCQIHEVRLYGPMDAGLIEDILKFLKYWNNPFMQKLSFKNVLLSDSDADLMATALRLISPPVKHVEFINCIISNRKVIGPILEACSGLRCVSFSQNNMPSKKYDTSAPRKKPIIIPHVEFSSLTYLKLCLTYQGDILQGKDDTSRLCGMLRQCPNLVHLLLATERSVLHSKCAAQAVEYCPRLRNLVVSPLAEIPKTMKDWIDKDGHMHSSCTTVEAASSPHKVSSTDELQGFVFTESTMHNTEHSDIISILDKAHKSLMALFISCNGYSIDSSVICRLASHGAPHLRELHLLSPWKTGSKHNEDTIEQALVALFSHCPSLEVIEINNTCPGCSRHHHDGFILKTNDEVLLAIARNCPMLYHLKISGCHRHSGSIMYHFADTVGSKLAYLGIDMDCNFALKIVEKLPALKVLDILNYQPNRSYSTIMPVTLYERISQILQRRGGDLGLYDGPVKLRFQSPFPPEMLITRLSQR